MSEPTLQELVLKHLEHPLKPIKKELLGENCILVEFPTENLKSKGGLSELGENKFKEEKNILAKSEAHKKETQISLRDVVETCILFSKFHKNKITPNEMKQLIQGIPYQLPDGKMDYIQTTRKNGEMLAKDFKHKMTRAFNSLKTSNPKVSTIIQHASYHQQIQEEKEMKKRENIDIPQ